MADKQIVEYIKNQIQAGVPRENISTALAQNGWSPSDIDSAFLELGNNFGATPQATQGFNNPVSNQVSNPVGGKKSKLVMVVVIVLLLLGISGGGVWAYFNFISPDPQQTIDKALLNYADYIGKEGLLGSVGNFQLKASGVNPQNPSTNASVDINFKGDSQSDTKSNKSSLSLSFGVGVKGLIPGMDLDINGDNFLDLFISKTGFFFKVNKIPSGLEQFTQSQPESDIIIKEILGKWVKIDQSQLDTLGRLQGVPTELTSFNFAENTVDSAKFQSLVRDFTASNIIAIDQVLSGENIDGTDTFHYKVKIDENNLKNFFLLAFKKLNNGKYPEGMTEESMRNDLNFDAFLGKSDKDKIDSSFEIWISKYSKLPMKFAFNADLSKVPTLSMMGVKSLTFNAGSTFSFPKTSTIAEPTSFITLTELLTRIGLQVNSQSIH